MATVKVKNQPYRHFGETVPYGNVTTLVFRLTTNEAGAVKPSDSDELKDGDVIDLGALPGGLRLDDAQIIVTEGLNDGITGSLGFAYEDGEDVEGSEEDAAYFGAGLNLAAAGRVRAQGSKLITLPKPARLLLTIAGADNAKDSEIAVLITGEVVGME